MMRQLVAIFGFMLGMWQVALCSSIEMLPALPALPDLPALSLSSDAASSNLTKKLPAEPSLPIVMPAQSNSLDTVVAGGQDGRGSWFKKRHWLLKAREQQEKINSLVSSVQDVGGSLYDSKRAAFNQAVEDFYEKNSVGRGQIDQLLDQLAPYFNQSGKKEDDKSGDSDASALASSKKFQEYFDNTVLFAQLKADLAAIADIDSGVAERVAQFEKCSQQALQKAAEAQKIVNEIFPMINHEKARESYYKLEGIAAYLDAILKFVKADLATDLDKLIGLGKSRMDDVSKVVINIRAACDTLKKSDSTVDDSAKKNNPEPVINVDQSIEVDQNSDAPKKTEENVVKEPASSASHGIFEYLVRFFYWFVDLFYLLFGI